MKKKIHIVGAGFSGLTAAYYLRRAGHEVEVFESQTQAGGMLQTKNTSYGLVEGAANAFLLSEKLQEIADTIGLELEKAKPAPRYILKNRVFSRWPLDFFSNIRLFFTFLQFLFQKNSLAPRPQESLAAWGERNLGQQASDYLLSAALQGVYAGDSRELSASLILGKFFAKRKSKLRGSVAPRQGMQSFCLALTAYLQKQGVRFHFGQAYTFTDQDAHTVIATNAPAAARLLSDKEPKLASALAAIKMLPLASVTLFYPSNERMIRGFGCLFPEPERFRVLGILSNNEIFSGRSTPDSFSETWILGGARDPKVLELSDEALLELVQAQRTHLFPENPKPLAHTITLWPNAIPHYDLSLEKILQSLPASKNITLVGNYMGEIGLSRILERNALLPKEIT